MSIFKETFRDFVFTQLRIREAILKKGNLGDSRFSSIENFSPRTEIKGKDGKTEKITIDAGAFYTNTVNKQCTIRLCSGVDINDDEETIKTILEDSAFEKARDLTGAGLAIRYILEGGVPAKSLDFTKNISKEEGKKEYGRDPSKAIGVIPRGRGNRGFGKNYGSAYGDPYLRSDAADGFGIVPMPGITDADIRTKTAYGSLREAKINFVCHNRRQLEVLELLYMRPGYPLLLEWGWDPYINNKGKRESYFPYIREWFKEDSNINQINSEIVRRKRTTGGNYDGFVGFVKNFEITSRNDGGYNCTTELVAMGEVIEGLKGRRSDFTYKDEEGQDVEVDALEFLFIAFKDLVKVSYLPPNATKIGGTGIGELKEALKNTTIPDFIIALKNVGLLSEETQSGTDEELKASAATIDKYNLVNDRDGLSKEEKQKRAQILIDSSKNVRDALKEYFIFHDDPLTDESKTVQLKAFGSFGFNVGTKEVKSQSGENYVRWDFLVELFNLLVVDRYQENSSDPKPLTELTVLRDPLSKDNPSTREYLEYTKYKFDADKTGTISNLVDSSIDLSVCILPHQIPTIIKESKSSTDELVIKERSIGLVYINIEHLIKVYNSMRYSGEGTNENFNLIDFWKKIWEQDINEACAGTHNFMVQTETERSNVLRVIDFQNEATPALQPESLFELKIQSNESIVRDFNFNTTIPSALSATVAIAAQAPNSTSDLDQVTFKKFNKHTSFRFNNDDKPKPSNEGFTESQQKEIEKKAKDIDKEKEELNNIIKQLMSYQKAILFGEKKDEVSKEKDLISANEAKGYIKGIEKKILSIQSKYHENVDDKLGPFKGFPKLSPDYGKSAVIPLKFNAKLDGIGGIIIGNVFKVEKNKLPKGYQGDDIAFVVMGESQKITSGQDWTTEINGQLLLLDLPPKEGGTENSTGQTGTPTNTTTTSAETSITETSTEEKNQLDEADKTVGNTGLTQEEIDAGKLETTSRKVNGHKPYEYAYLIQSATNSQNGAISTEFFKGNTTKVNKINELIDFLKENYASDFQYNFKMGDFPTLDNANVGSAYSSYDAWVGAFIKYFPEFRSFVTIS
tara:strand:- start:1093 stop:4338 length:3246 start_codon:yes stop_codon:yes gene_type:complete